MRIDPAFEYGTWVSLDNVWGVDIDVETEYERSIRGFELGGSGTPRSDLGCPRRRRGGISARQVSFVRPVWKGREWLRECEDRTRLSYVLFVRMVARRRGVRAGVITFRRGVKV